MSEMSSIERINKALALAKLAHVGVEFTYFDVLELTGMIKSYEEDIASLEAELKAECSADDSGSYDSLIPDEEFDALRARAEKAEAMVERLVEAGSTVVEWEDAYGGATHWKSLVDEWEGWS